MNLSQNTFTSEIVEKFWSRVVKTDGCWFYGEGKGYGGFYDGKRSYRPNRFSLILETGEDPPTKFSCHTCDTPRCVNPDHLYWGTVDENNNDQIERPKVRSITKRRGGLCMRGHSMEKYGQRVSGGLSCGLCTKLRKTAKKIANGVNISRPTVHFLKISGYEGDYDRLLQEYLGIEPSSARDLAIFEYRIVDKNGEILKISASKTDLEGYVGSENGYILEAREVKYSPWKQEF